MTRTRTNTLAALATLATLGLAAAPAAAQTLYASNVSDNTIEEFNTTTGTPAQFAADPGNGNVLSGPEQTVFDSAGNAYIANFDSNTIEEITFGGTASVFANDPGSSPAGLVRDSAGNFYAANANSNTIEKFTSGGVASQFASSGLNAPTFLTFVPAAAPEPSPLALFTLGALGLGALALRARKRQAA